MQDQHSTPPAKPYTPPSVWRVSQSSNPQKMGRTRVISSVDGASVSDLVGKYGSPLFVFSEKTLRETVRELRSAFESVYPDVVIAWSYKTNYLDAICRVFHQEGSLAEVVSGFEYEKAKNNGVPGSRIVFNGPYKTEAELRLAVAEGAMIQVDNRDELLVLAKMAEELDTEIFVGMRVNVDTGTHAVWSKFGFSADNGEASRTIKWVGENTRVRIRGLHCHVGTFMLDSSAYKVATEKLVGLASEVESCSAGRVRYINLGGGFASRARLHGQYLPPEQATPPFSAYAKVICGTIKESWPDSIPLPRLILETGRALVDDAGHLLTSVVAVKKREITPQNTSHAAAYGKSSSGILLSYGKGASKAPPERHRSALVLDSGINILYTTTWYQPSIHPSAEPRTSPRPMTAFGCLCMNIDVVREEVWLPELMKGDIVVVHPVGAYNITQSMQFISYRPAVVMVDETGATHLIRKREGLEDVRGPEIVPSHLSDIPHLPEVAPDSPGK